MLKNILKLNGAQQLSKNEQKEINGGLTPTTGCGPGGIRSNINSCLCNGGLYSAQQGKCLSGSVTGKVFENATSCCYNQIGGEVLP